MKIVQSELVFPVSGKIHNDIGLYDVAKNPPQHCTILFKTDQNRYGIPTPVTTFVPRPCQYSYLTFDVSALNPRFIKTNR
jgi:hypothetical protein